jgi:hypothetical protein
MLSRQRLLMGIEKRNSNLDRKRFGVGKMNAIIKSIRDVDICAFQLLWVPC